MKRNAIEQLKNWQETGKGPLFMYGIPGVGKTYLANNYANDFHNGFFYYKPEKAVVTGERIVASENIIEYLCEYFETDDHTIKTKLVIFDDTELMPELFENILKKACSDGHKWIFISSYDYLSDESKNMCVILRLFPLQFDEFLAVIGNEWYVEAIKEHFKTGKKLPDIVHTELLSNFEEYIWIGGMPDVINEYMQGMNVNVTGKQAIAERVVYDETKLINDASLMNKCCQIVDSVPAQIAKSNHKFMFNIIRTGVTYQMYSKAIDELDKRGLFIRINELSDDKKFKLYYPEFSFNKSLRSDEITPGETAFREENYIIQTLYQSGINVCFWESGNRAELPVVIVEGNDTIPVEIQNEKHGLSRSIQSYNTKHKCAKSLKIADSNFVDEGDRITIPIYACFCL